MDSKDKAIVDVGDFYMTQFLKGKKFRKTAWFNDEPLGNHEHCLFCGIEITSQDYRYETEKQAYASIEHWIWLCPNCFETYTKYRKLPLIENTVEMVESGLFEQKTVTFSLNNDRYILKSKSGKISVLHHGKETLYDSVEALKCSQLFYGKPLREIIGELFISVV